MAESSYLTWAKDEAEKILWLGRTIHIVVPSIVEPGEKFSVRISVVGPDQMPIKKALILKISQQEGWKNLPTAVEVHSEPVYLKEVSLEKEGCYRLKASFDFLGDIKHVYSNPVWCKLNPSTRLFWGDIHVHSIDGLCQPHTAKEPRFGMEYARRVTFLDFVAITDHVRGLDASKWEKQRRLVREFNKPGEFIPFLAFESSHRSGRGGDNNVYYKGFDGRYFWLDREDMKGNNPDVPLEELWSFLERQNIDFITIPHHTGRMAKYRDWDRGRYSPDREPLFEIYSMWGSSECYHSCYPLRGLNTERPAYFVDALRLGCRYGVIASGDDHTTMPGSETPLSLPGWPNESTYTHHGIAGIFASRLDRNHLWQAMKERRTLASTYYRTLLFFEATGEPAGSVIQLSRAAPELKMRQIKIKFLPSHAGCRLSLLRNGEVIHMWDKVVSSPQLVEAQFIDKEAFESVAIRNAPYLPQPFIVYYARLDYLRGGTVWSSPIWFVR